jgi:abortive infection bacteriophage resistance protein
MTIPPISTKDFKTIDEQISLLQDIRSLKINDVEIAKDHLRTKNYFDLINGFETLLLVDQNDKSKGYKAKNFNDFIYLYDFDRKISKEIFSSISVFEIKLKTSIAYHFTKQYCNNPTSTMEYLNRNNYIRPPMASLTPRERYLYNEFNDFIFFKTFTYNGLSVDYVEKQKSKFTYINRYQFPPLWIIMKTLMFNDLFLMLNYLDSSVLKLILADFGYNLGDKKAFFNSVEVIKELRNECAHFQLISRFRTSGRLPINNHLITTFSLNPKNLNTFRLSLYDSLKILNQFVSTKNVIREFLKFNIHMMIKNRRIITIEIFDRMGTPSLKQWKKVLY